MVIGKATSALMTPKLSSRLGGFHLIILAAFTLLGFYVCFNQIRGLKIDLLTLKALLQDPKQGGGTGDPEETPEETPEPGFEEIAAEDLQDAAPRAMLADPVSAPHGGPAGGVTVVSGEGDEISEVEMSGVEVEEIAPEETGQAPDPAAEAAADPVLEDNISALSVKDLRAMATEKGIAVRAGAKKADIVALIRESETGE